MAFTRHTVRAPQTLGHMFLWPYPPSEAQSSGKLCISIFYHLEVRKIFPLRTSAFAQSGPATPNSGRYMP